MDKIIMQFAVEGRKYDTYPTRKFLDRKKWEQPNPNQVLSQIPGTVIEIHTQEGQEVKTGEVLMAYKAMKMINSIVSHKNGKVKKISVKEGQNFSKGTLLIEIE